MCSRGLILIFFDKVRVLIFALENRVRSLSFWSFCRKKGEPLLNVFLRAYFDVFRQSSCFNFRFKKQFVLYVFGVFVNSIGGRTPGKRVPE